MRGRIISKSQAINYAQRYIDRVIDSQRGADMGDEISALIYMYRISKKASEIVGAIKLFRIIDILRTKTIRFYDGLRDVYEGLNSCDYDEIRRIILENPRMMGYKGDQDARL